MTKYRAKRCEADGITFASLRERDYYLQLKTLLRAGAIRDLELQVRFTLQQSFKNNLGHTERAIIYVADFSHFDMKRGKRVITEVKGFKTQAYNIKRKLFLYKFPDLIFEEV